MKMTRIKDKDARPDADDRNRSPDDRIREDPYKTDKLAYHPDVVRSLRAGSNDTLVQVHLMPQNTCNQHCNFCPFRMPDNKNAAHFDESRCLAPEQLERLAADMKTLGVRAVEVTGGGEPLSYKHRKLLFELLFDAGFDVALATNGTLLNEEMAAMLAPRLTWMRISLDAARRSTYTAIRRCPESHYDAAIDAFRKIRSAGPHRPDFRLGAGFVMTNGNELEVYEACVLAKKMGADNIRLGLAFADSQSHFFRDPRRVEEGIRQAAAADRELSDSTFQIIDLMQERRQNIAAGRNDYPYCYTKDILCVIEGEGNVYTCCTFTGSTKGLIGNIVQHPQGLQGVWMDSQTFRRQLDPRTYCTVPCLYLRRNLDMIQIVGSDNARAPGTEPLHVNFI